MMRYSPAASVTAVWIIVPSRYKSTLQPVIDRSAEFLESSKLASCHTDPLRMATPGMPPTASETAELAVCVGVFQETVPVFVTIVPSNKVGARVALNRSEATAPGSNDV